MSAGCKEGRSPKLPTSAVPVTKALLKCLKKPQPRQEMALFVTYSPRGVIKPHVNIYVEALQREGVGVTQFLLRKLWKTYRSIRLSTWWMAFMLGKIVVLTSPLGPRDTSHGPFRGAGGILAE